MAPTRLPSPEEYGRRLAAANQRRKKRARERTRKTETSLDRVLMALDEQKAALKDISTELVGLPREVLTPTDMKQLLLELADRLTGIQQAIRAIDLDVPSPTIPESLQQTLDDLLQMARQPVQVPAPPPAKPATEAPSMMRQETIFAGPITLKVTNRDSNGNIEDVLVEPTRH